MSLPKQRPRKTIVRKIKKIEFRFRRRLARVPLVEVFGVVALYYLIMAGIHTDLSPYLVRAESLFVALTAQEAPVRWTGQHAL